MMLFGRIIGRLSQLLVELSHPLYRFEIERGE